MRIILLACAGICLTGCATITRGTTQDFTVVSTPPSASVKTTTGFECAATPCTFKMPRKNAFSVEVKLDGYQTETVAVESKVAGSGAAGMAGNILVGGLIGVGVDASSGATKDLTPNPLTVTLTPNGQPRPVSAAPTPAPVS
jgi:membrane-bound inhibitor of C-type lysozyme